MLPQLPNQQVPSPSLKIPFLTACLLHVCLMVALAWIMGQATDVVYTPLVSIELSASIIEGNSPVSPQLAPQQGKQSRQTEPTRQDGQDRREKQNRQPAVQKSEISTPPETDGTVNALQAPSKPPKPQAKKPSPKSQTKTKAMTQTFPQESKKASPSPLATQAGESSTINDANTSSLTGSTAISDIPANTADTTHIASKPKGNPKAEKAYLATIVQKLHRSLRYPESARAKRISGTTTVQFTVSAKGHVSDERIHTGSGHPELDKEALALVQRAAPFKAIPSSLGHESITLTVPIRFSLK